MHTTFPSFILTEPYIILLPLHNYTVVIVAVFYKIPVRFIEVCCCNFMN